MDFFVTLSQGDGLASGRRDDVELAYFFVAVFIAVVVVGVGIFFGGGFALGEEGDPAAVGRPLGLGVVTGLGQLNQCVGAVEPEIGAEDLLVPVGALGGDHDGIAVGRDGHAVVTYRVEEFVESQLGLAVGKGERGERKKCGQPQNMF